MSDQTVGVKLFDCCDQVESCLLLAIVEMIVMNIHLLRIYSVLPNRTLSLSNMVQFFMSL